MKYTIAVLRNGEIIAEDTGEDYAGLFFDGEYIPGDCIEVKAEDAGCFAYVQLDDATGADLCLLKSHNYRYEIPFGEKKTGMSPKAFSGNKHLLYVKSAKEHEIYAYRNLAVNVYDNHENDALYPHAYANVETRNEAVFAARNAIDGNTENRSHGEWPYESWGINRNPNAEMTVDLGCEAIVDKIILYTRADFPHDSWWTQATITFSDNSEMVVDMQKSTAPHEFTFSPIKTSKVTLSKLIKADDESPFPALSQIEIYGKIQ